MLRLYVLVYDRAYHTYCINLIVPGTSSLWASTTRTTAVRVYNSIYMTFCTERFTCGSFGTATAVTTAVVAVLVLTLTHRYNAVRGHRTGSNNLFPSSVQYARNIMRLFLDETHARGVQIRYVTRTYVWLFGEDSACTTGRRAFGCPDTVMVNM